MEYNVNVASLLASTCVVATTTIMYHNALKRLHTVNKHAHRSIIGSQGDFVFWLLRDLLPYVDLLVSKVNGLHEFKQSLHFRCYHRVVVEP